MLPKDSPVIRLPVSLGGCEELTFPPGTCPWRERCFHLCFYRQVWVKSSPSVVFHVILGIVWFWFFFPLKCRLCRKHRRWEGCSVGTHEGQPGGNTRRKRLSYPSWDHIR